MRPNARALPMLLTLLLPALQGCGAMLLTRNAFQTGGWQDSGDPIHKAPRAARYVEPRVEPPSVSSDGLTFTMMEREVCPHKVVQHQHHRTPEIEDKSRLLTMGFDGVLETGLLVGYGYIFVNAWDKQEALHDVLLTTTPIPLAYLAGGALNWTSNRWPGRAVRFEDAPCGDWAAAAHIVTARFTSFAFSGDPLPAERKGTDATWNIPAASLGKIILASDDKARLEPAQLDVVAYVETMSLPGAKRDPVSNDTLQPRFTTTVLPTSEQWMGWQCAQIATMKTVTPELTPNKIAALLPTLERTCSSVAAQARRMACATTGDVVARLAKLDDFTATTWASSGAETLENICGVAEQNELRAAIRTTYARLTSVAAADALDASASGLYADVTRDLADERSAAYGRAFDRADTNARHALLRHLHERLPEAAAPREWEERLSTLARETERPTVTLGVLETWSARLPAASRTAIAQLSETALAASDFDAANVVLTKYPNLPDARTYAARMDAMRMGQLSVAQPTIDAMLEKSEWKAANDAAVELTVAYGQTPAVATYAAKAILTAEQGTITDKKTEIDAFLKKSSWKQAFDAAVALRASYGRTPAVAAYVAKAVLSAEQGAIADTKPEVAEKMESEYWSGIVELTDGLIEQYPGSAPVAAYARAASATARMKIAQEEARERAEAAREAAKKRACYGTCMQSVRLCHGGRSLCTPAPNDCKMQCGTYGD